MDNYNLSFYIPGLKLFLFCGVVVFFVGLKLNNFNFNTRSVN